MSQPSAFAILSPCSTCANQRAVPDANGGFQNYCPRRNWQNIYSDTLASTNPTEQAGAPNLRHLALTGVQDADDSGTFTGNLVNPVYDNTGGSILVWVAKVENNTPIKDSSGNVLNPSILTGSGSFDTNYIQCETLPFGPETNEATFFQNGGYREWEVLSVTPNLQQQSIDGSTLIPNGGSVKRAIMVGQTPRKPSYDHQCPEGT